MGDPSLDLDRALALAKQYDLQFVELRVLEENLDLPGYFSRLPKVSLRPDVKLLILSSSLKLISANENDLAEFSRYIDLAKRLEAAYIRVFGGGVWGEELSDASIRGATRVVSLVRKMIADAGWPGQILLETHSAFSSSTACERLNAILDEPLQLIWDTHHTWRIAGESPAESWRRLGFWIRHIHVKDSVSDSGVKDGYRYVIQGTGEFPSAELIGVLSAGYYSGSISLEWEKLWHPELPDLKEALPPFISAFR